MQRSTFRSWFATAMLVLAFAPCARTTLADANGTWREIPPLSRADHSLIYDAGRDRLVLYGGSDGDAPSRGDVWTLSLADPEARWTRLEVAGAPPAAREAHVAIFDPAGDRMLVFGGAHVTTTGETVLGDTWQLSFGGTPAWMPVPADSAPSARRGATAIFDPLRQRVVLHGGRTGNTYFKDTWSFDLAADGWTRMNAPAAGGWSSNLPWFPEGQATYDPVHDYMYVSSQGNWWPGVWGLDLGVTQQWAMVGGNCTAGCSPATAMAVDPLRSRVLAVGERYAGYRSIDGSSSVPDVNAAGALVAGGAGPWTARGAASVYDPVRDRLIVVGGARTSGVQDDAVQHGTWALSLSGASQWTGLAGSDVDAPASGDQGVACYDPEFGGLVIIPGISRRAPAVGGYRTRTYGLSVDDGGWSVLADSMGVGSEAIGRFGLFRDPVRPRWLLIAEAGQEVWVAPTAPTGTWTLWRQAAWAGDPRSGVLDAARDRLLVLTDGDASSQGVWAVPLDGSPSTRIATTVPPVGRHVAVDPVADRLVTIGRESGGAAEVWTLSLAGPSAWSLLPASAPPDLSGDGHAFTFDVVRNRVVLHAAGQESAPWWALALDGTPSWSPLEPVGGPSLPAGVRLVADPANDRLFALGGPESGRAPIWALEWSGASVAVESSAMAGVQLVATPHPASRTPVVQFRLPSAEPATVELLDVAGRRRASVDMGRLGAGRHRVAFDPETPLEPGVYVVRLVQGGRVHATRVVVTR